MKLQKYISSLLDVLIVFFLLAFFSSFGFRDGRSSGWYQQFFPNLNGSSIVSMTFLDSLTGYAATNTNSLIQGYILKTTNGGDNWNIIHTYIPPSINSGFIKIQFVNNNIGFAATNYYDFFKTTNGGLIWINYPNTPTGPDDIYAINEDTILYVNYSGFGYGVYRTTNGGISWQGIWTNGGGSGNPSRIYMYDKNIGFTISTQGMRKTTNGGVNWFSIPNETYTSIKFIDSLIGWKASDSIKKTTNGGINWFSQRTPNVINGFTNYSDFSILNRDTVWMVGILSNFTHIINPIFITTNGGINWGYQNADSTHLVGSFNFISFVNSKVGWAKNRIVLSEIHTTVGGDDTTFLTSINNNGSIIPNDFILFQNYPNPFNTKSKIKYQILKSANIEIKIYDVRGSEISTIVNKKLNSGMYEITFDGSNLSSGMYFYSLFADGERIDTKKLLLLK